MQLLQLQLENTKSYENAVIDFTAGTNAIVGHNGAGKSTILEAIGFALFDSMAYRQSDFVREGAKTATVTITFVSSLDERQYQIVRRCGSSGQYYAYDPELGAKVCEGKVDVLAFLKEHMAVDGTASLELLFSNAVGVPQGRLTAAFLDTPGQRKGVFDTLLQVEEYRGAADKLREATAALRDQLQKLELVLTEYTTRLERLPELEKSLAQRATQLAEIERDLKQISQRLTQLGAERGKLETVQQQIQELQKQQSQSVQRQESVALQTARVAAALDAAEQANVQVQQNLAGYEAYVETQKEHAALSEKEQQRQQLINEQLKVEKRLSLLQAEERTLRQSLAEVDTAEAKVEALSDAVARQSEWEEQLATAQRQLVRLQEVERSQQEQQKQLVQLQKRFDTLKNQFAQSDALEARRKEIEAESIRLRKTVEMAQQVLARYKADADAMKEQNEALAAVETAQCPLCEQPLTPEHRAAMVARNELRLQELRQKYGAERQIITQHEAEERSAREQIEQLDTQLRRLPRQEEIEALQAEVAQRDQTVAALADQLAQLEQVSAQVRTSQEALAALGNPKQQSAVAQDTANRRPRLQKELDTLTSKLEVNQQELQRVQEHLVSYTSVAAELAQAAKQLQLLQPAYQLVLANRQLADTVTSHQAALETLAGERTALEKALRQLESDLAEQLALFDAGRYKAVTDELESLRGKEVAAKTQLAYTEQAQAQEQAEVERLNKQKAQVESTQKEKEAVQHKIDILDAMRSVLRQAGPYITRALIQQVSSSAAQFFGDMMQDYSRHLAWNEDYGITLTVDGHERQFSQLSGGEQMSAALSVRLALLREMSSIAMAFFDEPTMNLDEGRRESLARQITDIRGFQQLFVISHDDTFEQATQNIIRVERKNGLSVVHSAS